MRENGEKPPTRGYDKQHADDERERDDPAARADAFFASRRDDKGDILEGLFAKAVVERRRQQLEQLDRHKQNGAGGEPGETPGPPGSVKVSIRPS